MEASSSRGIRKYTMNPSSDGSPRKNSNDEEQGAISYIKSLIHSQQSKKDKNDRSRFLGEGVSYKAKLIGILEVSEARGDRMCQEALADLKMAIRAAGEHKQRININIAIDGLRLRDEKTGDCLYHHPVHKISFIAQDMTDSRAFGYIFGSPDTGHRFFGIKTDKAASQVVISMRDLFQVVFELKKKEIEMAKQHIEQHQMKFSSPFPHAHLGPSNSSSNGSSSTLKASVEPIKMLSLSDERRKEEPSSDMSQKKVVDLLLDLELELSNIHQGISQMIKITPCDPMGSSTSMKIDQFEDSFSNLAQKTKLPPPPDSSKRNKNENQWFDQESEVLFEEPEVSSSHQTSNVQDVAKTNSATSSTMAPASSSANTFPTEELLTKGSDSPKDSFDVFTDLDPLGTGRSRPYVDKKDFFQDLKNPPKKLLKDLVNEIPLDKSVAFKPNLSNPSDISSKVETEGDSAFMVKPVGSRTFSDPFQDDPFDKDPFVDEFIQDVSFKSYATDDPFEKFADFTSFDSKENNLTISPPVNKTKLVEEKHSPLKVSLPPEKITSGESSISSPLQSRKFNKLQKHNSISGNVTLPSPKQKSRKNVTQISVDAFGENVATTSLSQNSLNLDQLPNDISAPEPPPRVNLSAFTGKPPPLPPKKVISSTATKPVPRLPNSDYDYIENYQSNAYTDFSGPPLPAPARKSKNGQKPSEPEYYLQPFPLLPPPKKKVSPKSSESNENVQSSSNQPSCPTKSLDITLSQLTKTGFSDLAASLNMSPSSLSKMTLQDLTKCLENLSNDNQKKDREVTSTDTNSKIDTDSNSVFTENSDSSNYFSAEFEAHFGGISSSTVSAEESLFDKYAVFRELVEQEQKQALTSQEVGSDTGGNDDDATDLNEEAAENCRDSSKDIEKVIPSEDRYAALRDLCLDDMSHDNEIDGSDKEDSIVEASRLDEDNDLFPSHLEEDTDLLPSHPHSESTESPTVTMKEHQSVMETTIMEEDVSALDGDDDEVPEESADAIQPETEPIGTESVSEVKPDVSKTYESTSILPEVDVLESKMNSNSDASANNAWAKFENNAADPEKSQETPNEGHVSPWSADSKENDLSPTIQEKKKYCRPRRRLVRDEDENDEHWNMRMEPRSWSPSWRENGWSDGDSLCDEVPPYVRDYHCDWRGCRRRVSPWNSRDQSPWDEDERELTEDQWDDCRWQGESRQRQRYKGPSWEDERRRHYEEVRKSRKQMAWSSDLDRKSSRESLTWDDDDRYSKRSYVERRHRKWDDEVQGRHRRWRDRERVEPGKKMSVRYYRDRSHDHQWDDDYIEQSEVEQTHWPQRPRSCDRNRRQYGHHSSDDFSERRYPRTMNRDEYSTDIDYRRRAQTLQLQKSRRKHNVTSSPFEDDFNTHFGYSNEINFAGSSSDLFEGDIKPPSMSMDSRKKYQFSECSKQKDYSQFGSPHTPGSVHSRDDEISLKSSNRCCQQSPFEDDFTSPETRRCSGRSVSSDLSDPKSGDDVFYAEPKEPYKMKCDNRRTRVSNKSDPGTSSAWPSNKPVTPNSEYAQTDNCRKKNNITDREDPSEYSAPYGLEKKVNVSDYKPMLPSLKRSDSGSSLKKSESINIFARNRDPFDDDFFCESSSKSSGIEKGKSNFVDPVKWNDAFNSFNFADEPK